MNIPGPPDLGDFDRRDEIDDEADREYDTREDDRRDNERDKQGRITHANDDPTIH